MASLSLSALSLVDSRPTSSTNSEGDSMYHDAMSEKTSASSEDVEAQPILGEQNGSSDSPANAIEYRIPVRTKLIYLFGYFVLNLGLTLYNKALLGNVVCSHSSGKSCCRLTLLLVSVPLATHGAACWLCVNWLLYPSSSRIFHF